MNFDETLSPNVLENQTRLQNSAYPTRKSLIFRVLCAMGTMYMNFDETNSIRYKSRRFIRRLIWNYSVCQCPFYVTLGIHEFINSSKAIKDVFLRH